VVLAKVQRVEVEPLGFELRALGDLVAHRDEDVGDALGDGRDGVPGATRHPIPWQRDIDGLFAQHVLIALGVQHGTASVESGLDGLACLVDKLAGRGLLRLRQRPDLPAGQEQRGMVAKMGRLGSGERVQVGYRFEVRFGLLYRSPQGFRRENFARLRVLLFGGSGHNSSAKLVLGSAATRRQKPT
jgi:hypothetical protein